ESLSRYQRGGYYLVNLGDTFKDDRYKIYHKLGWGGFSTVWLTKDRDRNQWVSLKIITADSSLPELEHLVNLMAKFRGELSSNYIVQLLDSFVHEGPNGLYQCLVFNLIGPMGASSSTVIFYGAAFDILRSPKVEPLKRIDSIPLGNKLRAQIVDKDYKDIRILDFGESFYQGYEPPKLAQLCSLRVPETILTDCFDYHVDLWHTGYMESIRKIPNDNEPKEEVLLILLEDYGTSKLEQMFASLAPDLTLKPLLRVMQGLMRFLPSTRLTAEEALDLLGDAQD
ncbi:uncharacterized protein N7518_009350, partial [Penicillium psychrosexuale]|uniref:uncharacterized protein n=1 Tax=Penicillium psychrosexuale TaxID=1002107 RepID=UPI00254586FE